MGFRAPIKGRQKYIEDGQALPTCKATTTLFIQQETSFSFKKVVPMQYTSNLKVPLSLLHDHKWPVQLLIYNTNEDNSPLVMTWQTVLISEPILSAGLFCLLTDVCYVITPIVQMNKSAKHAGGTYGTGSTASVDYGLTNLWTHWFADCTGNICRRAVNICEIQFQKL